MTQLIYMAHPIKPIEGELFWGNLLAATTYFRHLSGATPGAAAEAIVDWVHELFEREAL